MSKKKVALVTGASGMDAKYLIEYLLEKDYEVYGLIRRKSHVETQTTRIDHLIDKIKTEYGDMTDYASLERVVRLSKPDEIYNLAAMSHVRISFDIPLYTVQVNALGVANLLEVVRTVSPQSKIYQASCYDKETRVFTDRGLLNYEEVKVGYLVFSINVENGLLERKKVNKIIIDKYKGEMIHFSNRRIDVLVTPNHKMLLDINDKMFYEDADKCIKHLKYENVSDVCIANPVEWNGKIKNRFDVRDYIDDEPEYNTRKNMVYEFDTEDLFYLMGIYIGDGYLSSKKEREIGISREDHINSRDVLGRFKKNNSIKKTKVKIKRNTINFAVPFNDLARKKITDILDKYGFEYSLYNIDIYFSCYYLARFFKLCGDIVYEKHIPRFLFDYDKKYLECLFDGIIDSDGYRRKIKQERQSLSTVSEQLKLDFVELCLRIGRIPKMTRRKNDKKVMIRGRVINSSDNNFFINVASKRTRKIYKKNIKKVDYDDVVWCLEVEDNHNFLIERNGFVAFSGNSSEVFGNCIDNDGFQRETTSKMPTSPYGCAKLFAYNLIRNYREAYKLFAVNGILFNHSSPVRSSNFVEQKIVKTAVQIKNGLCDKLVLGNMDSYRDFGHSYDYVRAMFMIMQQKNPDDFVISTGKTHSIRNICEYVFSKLDMDYKSYIEQDPKFMRPEELHMLKGDCSKAKRILGWKPKYTFETMLDEMIEHWEEVVLGNKYALNELSITE